MCASKLAAGQGKHVLASAEMPGQADRHRAENCPGLQTAAPAGNTPPAAARRQEAGVVASGDARAGSAAGICFVRPLLPVLLSLPAAQPTAVVCRSGAAGGGVQALLGRFL